MGEAHNWYRPGGSGPFPTAAAVEFCDFAPGVRGRVSPNSEGGAHGFTAMVFDGSREGFEAAPRLGKFPDLAAARAACVIEASRLLSAPRPFALGHPEEVDRLMREVIGYLEVSRNHGTDFEGRRFALDGMKALRERWLLERGLSAAGGSDAGG